MKRVRRTIVLRYALLGYLIVGLALAVLPVANAQMGNGKLATLLNKIELDFDRALGNNLDAEKSALVSQKKQERLAELMMTLDQSQFIDAESTEKLAFATLLEQLGMYSELIDFVRSLESRGELTVATEKMLVRSLINSHRVDEAARRLDSARKSRRNNYKYLSIYHLAIADQLFRRGDVEQSIAHLAHHLDAQIDRIPTDPRIARSIPSALARLRKRTTDLTFENVVRAGQRRLLALEASLGVGSPGEDSETEYRVRAAIQHGIYSYNNALNPGDETAATAYLESLLKLGCRLPVEKQIKELNFCRSTVVKTLGASADEWKFISRTAIRRVKLDARPRQLGDLEGAISRAFSSQNN